VSCLTAVGQLNGAKIETIEGLRASSPTFDRLQESFLQHGAAQCGICTPGMLVSSVALLDGNPCPDETQVMDALGGVLCRCTGYRKIVRAVLEANQPSPAATTHSENSPVGQRVARLDGRKKVLGQDIFGADEWRRIPCSSVSCARRIIARNSHLAIWKPIAGASRCSRDFYARDVPGKNCFGVIPQFSDQPVFAEREARFLGEPVAAIVGDPQPS